MGAVLSREVVKKMALMLQQYKQVAKFSGVFVFFSPIYSHCAMRGIGMGI